MKFCSFLASALLAGTALHAGDQPVATTTQPPVKYEVVYLTDVEGQVVPANVRAVIGAETSTARAGAQAPAAGDTNSALYHALLKEAQRRGLR